MATVERKNADRRTPTFYGRAVSLDGPRATIAAKDRAAYEANVRGLLAGRGSAPQARPTR